MNDAHDRIRSKAARLRRIEHRLYNTPAGMRVIDLAAECGVDRRTIYRDLAALDEMGLPVWELHGRFGIDRASYLSTVRLNLNEAIALYFAARLLTHHSDEHNPHIVAALDKLAAGLPDQTISSAIAQAANVVRARPMRSDYIRILETLTRAWADRRIVQLRYRALNRETTEREVAPYFIEVSRSTPAAYVIGYDRLRGAIRTFKIERIERAMLLDESYSIPPDFDPSTFLSNAWGVMDEVETHIHLRFNAQTAPRIHESVWHHSQEIEDRADGGCDLRMTIGGIREVLPWVLGWGADVEVLAPDELRREVATQAQRMLAIYT
ncbi:helix-turn-helix transcriptional regulator [Candidatus Oscillochloris fontis]|uniref:helix-turn-helix transcriptional regulator n=1 Tax=Candidatus Oscillochloris fontis TaxID=2496868 RepID=UPI00101E05B6|nr:WYL domain-containing protein [Candidatus Oscillochloris fontis]